ncbi:MAG: SH3 domain-containing protein [Spirochaetota bacterium]|nr:SH3 domain-containing protein [Spirochaetota bacterium]
MKRCAVTIFAFLLFSSILSAEALYVSSMKTSLYSKANRKSAKIMTLKRGARLNLLSTKGLWLQVSFANKKGWVSKMVTSKNKPGPRLSILGSAGHNARIHARKRASSDVTAASARGLVDDDASTSSKKRSRSSNRKSDGFDPAVLSKMEGLYIPEKKLLLFLSEAGIQSIEH